MQEFLLEWLGITLLVFVLVVALSLVLHTYTRWFIRSRYDWLPLLSLTDWKTGAQLRQEMEQKNGTSRGCMRVYSDMRDLIDEGLVEIQKRTQTIGQRTYLLIVYRRKAQGGQRKEEPNPVHPARRLAGRSWG